MRNKKAKRLRRLAQLKTKGAPLARYVVQAKGRTIDTGRVDLDGIPILRDNPDSLRLAPGCTRDYYQALKKVYV